MEENKQQREEVIQPRHKPSNEEAKQEDVNSPSQFIANSDEIDEKSNINAVSKHLLEDQLIGRGLSVFSAEKPKDKRTLLDFENNPINLEQVNSNEKGAGDFGS